MNLRLLSFLGVLGIIGVTSIGATSAHAQRQPFLNAIDTLLPKLRTCTKNIAEGHGKLCRAHYSDHAHEAAFEGHAIQVKVEYEPVAIGGILTVQADLLPLFNGVGVQARPVSTKSVTQAVDKLSPQETEEILSHLIEDLTKDYNKGFAVATMTEVKPNGSIISSTMYQMNSMVPRKLGANGW